MAPALRDVKPRIQSRFKDRCGHLTDPAPVRLNDLPVQYGIGLFETGLGSLLTHCMIKGKFISGIQDDLPAFFHCHTDIGLTVFTAADTGRKFCEHILKQMCFHIFRTDPGHGTDQINGDRISLLCLLQQAPGMFQIKIHSCDGGNNLISIFRIQCGIRCLPTDFFMEPLQIHRLCRRFDRRAGKHVLIITGQYRFPDSLQKLLFIGFPS